MSRKVFSTFFTLILLIVIAVPGLDAWPGVDVVDGSAKISAFASTLNHAPTGNILKKYRREGGQWVYVRTIEAEWFCRVRMQAKFTGYGNASIGAEGQTVKRATGSTFETLSPDASTTRISSYLFFDRSEPLELFARAQGTVKTKNENEVGGYKVTGKGYYEIGHGGDGIGLSIDGHGGSATIGGIDSQTMSMPLDERNQPHFDIDIQCDPAEACSGNSSPPPTGSTPPPSGSTPPTGSTPPPSNSDIQYACGDHSGPSSGSSGHTAASCGTSGHYICDGADHSLQASCPSTDSNGNSCTVTNFYACSSHTHSYPSPPPPTTVACGGASYTGCSGASSRKAHHRPSCDNCNTNGYWTCGQYAYRHTTENTCRRPGCGVTYYECQNGPCSSDWGTYAYHWAE